MGKRHFKGNNSSQDKKRRKEAAEAWRSVRGDESERKDNWDISMMTNDRFEAFYAAQGFLKDDEDVQSFLDHLRKPLPACFRISLGNDFAEDLRKQLEHYLLSASENNEALKTITPLKWYPGNLAYKLPTDRRAMRKDPTLKALHKWMVQHTASGNVTRQEAVSMVPPLALGVEKHHKVLDMCAAPGSKTSQLLEIVNQSLSSDPKDQGLVVANDSDTDRAYMLVHQCRRAASPLLVVTTHNGQNYPSLRSEDNSSAFFDRVLCDVPCSGDGTMRKNPLIWGKWQTSQAQSIHPLQLLIAQRGVQLLKEEGLLVYSTCSNSPYENESVVAELLRTNPDLELVDIREKFLHSFKAREGLSDWYVLDDFNIVRKEMEDKRKEKALAKKAKWQEKKKQRLEAEANGEAVDAKEEAEEEAEAEEEVEAEAEADAMAVADSAPVTQDFSHIENKWLRKCLEMGMSLYKTHDDVPENLKGKFKKSFFPPSDEEKATMNLKHCLRCVPQDEDTGGFFVATFRKKTKTVEQKAAEAAEVAATEAEKPAEAEKTNYKKNSRGLVEFLPWKDTKSWEYAKDFYKFSDRVSIDDLFVREDHAQSAQREDTENYSPKTIYYLPDASRSLLNGDKKMQLKVVAAGVKMFEKNFSNSRNQIEYRLLQDGLPFVVDHVADDRKVPVTIQEFCNLLGGGLVNLSNFSSETLDILNQKTAGTIICSYVYNKNDFLSVEQRKALGCYETQKSEENTEESGETAEIDSVPREGNFVFHILAVKNNSRTTLNVMCGKTDVDNMKHQLMALSVYRPKISNPRPPAPAAPAAPVTAPAETVAVAEAAAEPSA